MASAASGKDTVQHTEAVSRDDLVAAIEEQGYEVPAS